MAGNQAAIAHLRAVQREVKEFAGQGGTTWYYSTWERAVARLQNDEQKQLKLYSTREQAQAADAVNEPLYQQFAATQQASSGEKSGPIALASPKTAAASGSTPTGPPSSPGAAATSLSSADTVELRDYVKAQTSVEKPTKQMLSRINEVAAQAATLEKAKKLLAFDLNSWRKPAAAAPTKGSLRAKWGLSSVQASKGEVPMGDMDGAARGSTDKKVLWTRSLGGCLGVAVIGGGRCFLAHFTPPQLASDKLPELIKTINSRCPLQGATASLCSPSSDAGYIGAVRTALEAAGCTVNPLLQSATLALRTEDGAVDHGFDGAAMLAMK